MYFGLWLSFKPFQQRREIVCSEAQNNGYCEALLFQSLDWQTHSWYEKIQNLWKWKVKIDLGQQTKTLSHTTIDTAYGFMVKRVQNSQSTAINWGYGQEKCIFIKVLIRIKIMTFEPQAWPRIFNFRVIWFPLPFLKIPVIDWSFIKLFQNFQTPKVHMTLCKSLSFGSKGIEKRWELKLG